MKASNENISSKNITNTISENSDNHRGGMKNSSTRELIKDLPDLDDSSKPNVDDGHIAMIDCNNRVSYACHTECPYNLLLICVAFKKHLHECLFCAF